jgi:hypothetical protein
MQAPSSGRVRVALLFLAGLALVLLLGLTSDAARSSAQTGTGYANAAPQDQVIQPVSGSGASHTGFLVGSGAAVVMIGGAALYGMHHSHVHLLGRRHRSRDTF